MFGKIFDRREKESNDFFNKISFNLFTGDLLVSSSIIIIAILMMSILNAPLKYELCFLIFPKIYALCFLLRKKQYLEGAYLLYHISSYLLVTCLILFYGANINLQLFYFSICFSIYLYATEPKKYQIYLLCLYIGSFVFFSFIPFNSLFKISADLKIFVNLNNLVMASICIIVKAIKYVNLKENAVEKYELSYLKSVETEKLLKEKEAIFDLLFNSSNAGAELTVFEKNTSEIIAYQANKTLIQLLKMNSEELRNKSKADLSPKYQSNNKKSIDFQNEIKDRLYKEKQITYQWDFYNSEGEIITAEVTELILEKQNTFLNLVLFKDVTKQKKTEKELLESELIYRTLFENVYDGLKIDIYNKTTNQKIDSIINKKMLDLFKVDHYNSNAKEFLKFIPKVQSNGKKSFQFLNEIRATFKKEQFLNFRMDFINAVNQAFTADLTTIEIEMGNTIKRVLIAKDVTELVKKEQIIQKQIQTLEKKHRQLQLYIESNKQLELFANKVSHDLKNPILTIGEFSQILKSINSEKLNKQSKEYLNFIESSVSNLILLIDDFLDQTKISNKKINIKKINSNKTIQFVLQNLKPKIEACNATIKINNLPTSINVDEIKFFTVMQNLISNAIRHRKPDLSPLIEISSNSYNNYFQFDISDNGVGIKEEHQTKIFEIYETFNKNLINPITLIKQESNGIGLSICLELVELHKGKLWVKSVYGEGSTFSFTIPKNLNQNDNN